MNFLSKFIMVFILLSPLFSSAQTKVGGGGDGSEARVDEIRADILKWIEQGGAKRLRLPAGMGLEEYESEMQRILKLQKVTVVFVENDHATDEELQVQVEGSPKTCRGFISVKDGKYHILCDIQRFKDTKEDEQYRLVHHEYAGLAGVERNVGAASDYEISNQLTGYLRLTTVLRLAVKDSPLQACGLNGSVSERIADCSQKNASSGKDPLILVARTENSKEVHLDVQTGLLWGNIYSTKMSSSEARRACQKAVEEMAGIQSLYWRLPTISEYQKLKSKLKTLLTIWTDSVFLEGPEIDTRRPGSSPHDPDPLGSKPYTRCVANS